MGCGSSKASETSEQKAGSAPRNESVQNLNTEGDDKDNDKVEGVHLGGMLHDNDELNQADWNAKLHGTPGALYEKFFQGVVNEILEPHYGEPILSMVFSTYASNGTSMTKEELVKFLTEEQLESPELAAKHAEEFAAKFGKDGFNIEAFRKLMFDVANAAFDPAHSVVYQDMTRPLTDYLISTSHNTYLGGRQIWDETDPEFYAKVITSGARVVELDTQDGDGDDEGEPVIHHAGWTKPLPVKTCLEKIAEVAFKLTDYPLFLMFEMNVDNHKQQDKIAKYTREIFGDKVSTGWEGRWMGDGWENRCNLPSPEDMKGKVFCSAGGGVNTAPLVGLMHMRVWNEVDSRKVWQYGNISETGLTETMLDDALANQLVKENQRTMCRVYPKGLRVDSSNFNPLLAWNAGCQFAALNFQTVDEMMWLHQGRFRQNGFCGFVLKPEVLLTLPADHKPTKYIIRVLCAKELREDDQHKGQGDDDLDPYCEIDIEGHPDDVYSWKSKVKKDQGSYVLWDEEARFSVTRPQAAMLRVVVSDKDTISCDDMLGQSVIPLTSLRPGYRVLHLQSAEGFFKHGSKVLIHTTVEV